VKPTYEVRAWQEDGWWLARITGASGDADLTPVNALTHARSLNQIEQVVRDLVAMILDLDEGAFDVEVEYVLPRDVDLLVCEAIGAQTWLEAARDLFRERASAAARALSDQGFSRREAATLLGLSDRRLDQLLRGDVGGGLNV
jgi:hypothetical protein